MSFRNSRSDHQENIRIQQNDLQNQLMLSSNFPPKHQTVNQEIIKKIATLIVSIHERYLKKCQHLEIYRDLTQEQQHLLLQVEKNSDIHTALAGILAIDSCVKTLEKEENFVVSSLIRNISNVIAQFKILQKQLGEHLNNSTDICLKLSDSIRLFIQQLYDLPSLKDREQDEQKQLLLLENEEIDEKNEKQYHQQHIRMVGQLQRENELLKVSLKEKEVNISNLQARLERGSKFSKIDQKRTSHSLCYKLSTEKSSQTESNEQISSHLLQQQIAYLKLQLQEKGNIICKMNDEFALEMDKFTLMLQRIEEQNRALKRYSDIDTVYLLQQLEYEIESLREQKRKDQFVINEIQRKIEGISQSRSSRLGVRQGYQYPVRNSRHDFLEQMNIPNYELRQPREYYLQKYYSPNFAPINSPYSKTSNFKEERLISYEQQETLRSNISNTARKGLNINEKISKMGKRNNSKIGRSRQNKDVCEPKSRPINLYERVMSKRI